MKRLFLGLFLIVGAWLTGLAAFLNALPAPGDAPLRHDAVIVFTGGGGARISAGMTLLSEGSGEKLLISGVDQSISRDTLASLWSGPPALYDCCVHLGWEARSTAGNAREAAQWANEQQASAIVLVTSDYHMPRAMTEISLALPNASITPYAVASGYLTAGGAPASLSAALNIAGEYNKFLLAKAKALIALT